MALSEHDNVTTNMLACPRLSVSGGLEKRAGDEWSPLAFSIVLTDRELGTCYKHVRSVFKSLRLIVDPKLLMCFKSENAVRQIFPG